MSAKRDRESLVVFGLTVAALLAYALRGGTYDVVSRGEIGLLAWWALLIGVVAGVLPRSRPALPTRLAIAGLAGICVWMTLSFAWTESDERTSLELALAVHHLGVFALAAAVLRPATVPAALAGALTAGAVVCVLAVGSRLFPGAFPEDVVRASLGGDRLSYPFNYWNAVAAWAVITGSMALAWSVHARSVATRALSLAIVPVAATAIYLTFARQGAAGLALGALVVVVFARTRVVAAAHAAVALGVSALPVLAARGADEIANASGTAGRGTVIAALLVAMALCAAVAVALARAGRRRAAAAPPRLARQGGDRRRGRRHRRRRGGAAGHRRRDRHPDERVCAGGLQRALHQPQRQPRRPVGLRA